MPKRSIVSAMGRAWLRLHDKKASVGIARKDITTQTHRFNRAGICGRRPIAYLYSLSHKRH